MAKFSRYIFNTDSQICHVSSKIPLLMCNYVQVLVSNLEIKMVHTSSYRLYSHIYFFPPIECWTSTTLSNFPTWYFPKKCQFFNVKAFLLLYIILQIKSFLQFWKHLGKIQNGRIMFFPIGLVRNVFQNIPFFLTTANQTLTSFRSANRSGQVSLHELEETTSWESIKKCSTNHSKNVAVSGQT